VGEHVVIVLPLPPRELHPNGRPHHMAKMRATKLYRAKACEATADLRVESGPWERATVAATFFHTAKRRRDDVNFLAALKAAYDGLVDGGLLEDDDAMHLITLGATFEVDAKHPRVELRVERVS
jgi:hypothetical protein